MKLKENSRAAGRRVYGKKIPSQSFKLNYQISHPDQQLHIAFYRFFIQLYEISCEHEKKGKFYEHRNFDVVCSKWTKEGVERKNYRVRVRWNEKCKLSFAITLNYAIFNGTFGSCGSGVVHSFRDNKHMRINQ